MKLEEEPLVLSIKEDGKALMLQVRTFIEIYFTFSVKQLILESDTLDDAKILDFFGEAELMMKLKGHPNITQLLGICGDPVCLITEFVDNGSLKKLLFSECPLDMSLQIRIARDIAAGTKLHINFNSIQACCTFTMKE